MRHPSYHLLENNDVTISDSFFGRFIDLVKEVVIPYQRDILNDRIPDAAPSHAIENFLIAAGEKEGRFYGEIFQDSDLFKWLEAVGNILLTHPDSDMEAEADRVIEIIEKAQQKDGYLNTYFTIEAPEKKWTNVLECHELYCAGHFIEAAVSYYKTTGKERILKTACRLADCIDSVFGPDDGKLHGYPGHQEIELALLRLYDVTEQERYYNLAEYFINARGTNRFFEEEFEKRGRVSYWAGTTVPEPNRWYNHFPYSYYNQFQAPVRQQTDAVGHAVRAVYMYTAMADLASRNKDQKLQTACRSLWDSIVKKQMYITGGIGSTHSGEAFTVDYDLPNDTNYSETCASIGLIFFAQKMLTMETDGIYADVMEKALYNTVLGGMSVDGRRFFYVNPLEVVPETCAGNTERNHVKPVRQKWFSCACCPPNIARLLASLQKYIYTWQDNTVYTHLYIGSEANLTLDQGKLKISQTGNYPWDGTINVRLETECTEEITVAFRIPGWCRKAQILVNGQPQEAASRNQNGYFYIKKIWKMDDEIKIIFDMPAELMRANKRIHYDAGRTAIQRGPLVYCLEEADNGRYLNRLSIGDNPKLDASFEQELLGGCVSITANGYREDDQGQEELYSPDPAVKNAVRLKAIPYYLWNNRMQGEMQVWVRKQ